MKKVIHIAKTNINTDGRILNEIQILKENFEDFDIHFILLPDKEVTIQYKHLFQLHLINCKVRHNIVLRPFTVLEFAIKTFMILRREKPDLIHAQDSAVSLPVLLYRFFYKKKTKIIYDDHEIPNENKKILNRINIFLENKLIKKADAVLFANKERLNVIKDQLNPKGRLDFLLNLSFFEKDTISMVSNEIQSKLNRIDKDIKDGFSFIIHQGVIKEERGSRKMADFSKLLPPKYKIMLLGGNKKDFELFLKKYNLKQDTFCFIGLVDYSVLFEFWKRGVASIVMYLPTYINNRLCAPNRLYLSYQNGLPILVNRDNPVLNNFISKFNCGYFIEDFTLEYINTLENLKPYSISGYIELVQKEKSKLIKLYESLLME